MPSPPERIKSRCLAPRLEPSRETPHDLNDRRSEGGIVRPLVVDRQRAEVRRLRQPDSPPDLKNPLRPGSTVEKEHVMPEVVSATKGRFARRTRIQAGPDIPVLRAGFCIHEARHHGCGGFPADTMHRSHTRCVSHLTASHAHTAFGIGPFARPGSASGHPRPKLSCSVPP